MLNVQYRLNSPSCIGEAIEDDLIIINLQTGRYYNMRHEAVACWQALMQGVTPAELVSVNAWGGDQTLRFQRFVQYLLEEQLLTLQEAPVDKAVAPVVELSMVEKPFHVDVFTDMEEMLLLDPIHDASVDIGWPNKA